MPDMIRLGTLIISRTQRFSGGAHPQLVPEDRAYQQIIKTRETIERGYAPHPNKDLNSESLSDRAPLCRH